MDKDGLLGLYRQMFLIRTFEDKSAEMYGKAKIGGFLHLANGQEAVCVGALSALNADDDLVTHYRDHGYAIARGVDPKSVMAELYGRAGGTTGGRGGSMHLVDVAKHFWGGYAIVGAHLPLAAGLAYAAKAQNTGRITLNVMGDGSTNIGTFHATLNWAQIWRLPIIFLVENNQYAMGTPIKFHSSQTEIYKKAAGYGMPGVQMDGMDVMAVRETMCEVANRVRGGEGPVLVEAVTYRYRGHSMADADVQRPRDEVTEWKGRDPISHFASSVLLKNGMVTKAELDQIEQDANRIVDECVAFAEASPEPARDTLYKHIYMQPVPNMQVDGSLIKPPTLYRNGSR